MSKPIFLGFSHREKFTCPAATYNPSLSSPDLKEWLPKLPTGLT